jgi:hypothetical protein
VPQPTAPPRVTLLLQT